MVIFTSRSATLAGCSTCGCYAFLHAVGLLEQCSGVMTVARAKLWSKLCSGYHPYTGMQIGEPQPLATMVRSALAQQACYIDADDED